MSQLRNTLVQCDLRWEDPQANHAHLEQLLGELDSRDTDLIVLPEMFATGFTMNSREMAQPMAESQSVAWLQAQAKARNCVMTGSVAIEEGGEFYNRLIWSTPEGALTHYDKRHLFRMAGEHERYGMGSERKVVELNGFKLLLSVCYDLRFPELYRLQRNRGVDTFVVPSAFTWSTGKAHWEVLCRARAIENASYVVAANQGGQHDEKRRTWGHSLVVDPWGEVEGVAEGEQGVTIDTDLDRVDEVRLKMPTQEHRRL